MNCSSNYETVKSKECKGLSLAVESPFLKVSEFGQILRLIPVEYAGKTNPRAKEYRNRI